MSFHESAFYLLMSSLVLGGLYNLINTIGFYVFPALFVNYGICYWVVRVLEPRLEAWIDKFFSSDEEQK